MSLPLHLHIRRQMVLLSLLLIGCGTLPVWLCANPTGGQVAAGSASIGTVPGTVTVSQASNAAIINWKSFSINAGELTKFVQPSAASAVLNRVLGGQTSLIDGTLQANGQVYLVNGNGIVVGPGGVITTGSFVGSTRDISDSDFLSGNLHFVGSGSAGVQNLGVISAIGGDVVLIGKTVSNQGTLNAPNGTVGLAAADDVLLAQTGSEHVFVNPSAAAAPIPGQVGVSNTGSINAAAAELRAANGNIYALAIQNEGAIRATTVSKQGGHIYLVADGGTVSNSGTLDASSSAQGSSGGSVSLLAGKGTAIQAGSILAKGGLDGSGGNAEVSGETVQLTGTEDLTASGGTTGTLFIDPTTLDVETGGLGTVVSGENDSASTISPSTVEAALASANLILNADMGITISNAVTWTSANTLTLSTNDAGSTIDINAAIMGTAGGLTIDTKGGSDVVSATGAVSVGTFILQNGAWNQNTASLPSFSATNFTISGGTFLRVLGGSGTSGSPYQLTDVYGLQGVDGFLSSDFELANDIDASGTSGWNSGAGFVPIGTDEAGSVQNGGNGFVGTFNGQGYTIDGLTIDRPSSNDVGLFGFTEVGPIENVGLTNVAVSGAGVGGLVGYNLSATITNSYVTGAVSGGANVGGLVGYNGAGGVIKNSYATCTVSGGTNAEVGGLVGGNVNTVENSYSTGAVSGGSGAEVGGLVGDNGGGGGSISDSYATGAVSDGGDVGGLVGANRTGRITNSYATGAVSGGSNVGGLVGYVPEIGNTITGSYATGPVSGSSDVGGLVGFDGGVNTYTDDYFDSQTTGTTAGVGSGSVSGVTAQTTAQLQSALPTGFSGSTWAIVPEESYPYLTWRYPSGVQVVSGTIAAGTAGATVDLLGNGTSYGSVASGANGYYYFLFDPNMVPTSDAVLTYLPSGAANAVSVLASATGSDSNTSYYATGLNLAANTVTLTGNSGTIVTSELKTALPSVSSGAILYSVSDQTVNLGSNALTIASASTNVGIDDGIRTTGTLTLDTGGGIATAGTVNVGSFVLQAGAWTQNEMGGGSLPAFSATNFTISGGTFLRVLNGNGSSGNPYQLTDVYGLQGVAGFLSSDFELANDIDASGTVNWNSVAGFVPIGNSFHTGFNGTFNGQNHTINGLTIDGPGGGFVGLFGVTFSGSVIENIGLTNENISSGSSAAGGLVGLNEGMVEASYSTGAVSGGSGSQYVGGLVGLNDGTVEASYSTDVVSGGDYVGGLVGNNNNGTVEASYSTGAVSGGSGSRYVGGLVGLNDGTVEASYSTGAVSGTTDVGGLVGANGGLITASFWDVTTSGQNGPVAGAYGLTTAEAQSESYLATTLGWSFNGSPWSIVDGGTYPFFAWRYEAVGGTAPAGATVAGLANGSSFASPVTAGAGGVYYFLLDAGTIPAGENVLTYLTGATPGNAVSAVGTGGAFGLPLAANTVALVGNGSTVTTSELATALGSFSSSAILYSVSGGTVTLGSGGSLTITGGANNISIDDGVSVPGTLTVDTTGTIGATGAVNVGSFVLQDGAWTQNANGGTLPAFNATNDFEINGGTFLRVLNGNGSSVSPYQLKDVYGLQGVNGFLSSDFELANDIDATGTVNWNGGAGFVPIGNSTAFTGNFNGQGNTITGLTIDDTSDAYVGLFGQIGPGGTVNDVGLVGGSVTGSGTNVGELAGSNGDGTITDSYATGTVNGSAMYPNVGGLVGYNAIGTISNSYATGMVTSGGGDANVGGLVGNNTFGGTISNSYATGMVTSGASSANVGGLVGYNTSATVSDSYATGAVSGGGTANVGGLVGYNTSATVSDSYATGAVSGGGDANVGGLVGYNTSATVSDSYATGAVSGGGTAYVGGLVGNNTSATVSDSYATGAVVGGSGDVGGLAGYNYFGGTITDSYATGAVSGSGANVGGLVGANYEATVSNSYATGAINGGSGSNVGGLAGSDTDGTYTDDYFDSQTTGATAGVGSGSVSGVTAETTVQLQAGLLTGFSGPTWAIVAGESYPYLTWRYPNGVQVVSGTISASSSGATVNLLGNGTGYGSVTSGANGYYYFLFDPNTVPTGDVLLTYLPSGAANAVSAFSSATGTDSKTSFYATGLSLAANTVTLTGNSGLIETSQLAAALGSFSSSAILYSVSDQTVNLGSNALTIASASTNVGIDDGIRTTGTLTLDTGGGIATAGTVNVGSFVLQAGAWTQNEMGGGSLPAFSATNFTISGGTFLRVLNGNGSSGTPYQLTDVYGLQGVAGFLSSDFELANDIDASGTSGWNSGAGFAPIGNSTTSYTGTFNGRNDTINGLTIDRPSSDYVGLFGGALSGSLIENLGLTSENVSGAIVVGGLAGGDEGTVENSYSTGAVSGIRSVGGLVGGSNAGTVEASYSTSAVNGSSTDIGGLVGSENGTVEASYSTGAVSGRIDVGGLVGAGGTVENSYSTGAVSGGSESIDVGGLVGAETGTVEASYSTGAVSGDSNVGGLVGGASGTVENSYSTGAVSGSGYVGGLVGVNDSAVENSYSTGAVSGSSHLGGLVATNDLTGTVTASFWDVNTSGQSSSVGGTGLSTAEAQSESYLATHLGWSFPSMGATWAIVDGQSYPYLTWRYPNGVQVVSGTISPSSSGTTVNLLGNGAGYGSVASGANGYYYFLLDPNTVPTGDVLLTYLPSGAANAVSAFASATGTDSNTSYYATGLGLTANTVTLTGNSGTIATSELATAVGSANGLGILYSVSDGTVHVTAGDSLTITGGMNPISIDDGVTVPGIMTVDTTGTIGATGGILAGSFVLENGAWSQNSASLPSFSAGSFTISGGTFLRVLGGDGTSSPYQITDVYGLQGINGFLTSDFELANDIDATGTLGWNSGAGFVPIGNLATPFTGFFNGQAHTVGGLTIDNSALQYIGLFGMVGNGLSAGTVENVGLVDASVAGSGPSGQVGGLAGYNYDGSTITNSYVTGTVSGSGLDCWVGGLVGVNRGTITDSYATAAVSNLGDDVFAGGLVGNNLGTITDAYATGTVSGSGSFAEVGGLVGYNAGAISNSYATGAVSGTLGAAYVGGLVGEDSVGSYTDDYFDSQTTGASVGAGNDSPSGVAAETTAQLQSISTYAPSWNFTVGTGVWAVNGYANNGSGGAVSINGGLPYFQWQYPTVQVTASDQTVIYAGVAPSLPSSTAYTVTGNAAYLLSGPTLSVSGSNVDAGTTDAIVASAVPQVGDAVELTNGTLTINTAPLTVTADSTSKNYGQTVTFAGTEFTSAGLVNGEAIGSVTLTSAGAASTADVTGSPYAIIPSNATGGTFNPANYTITYDNGSLTVSAASLALTVTADNETKTYGQTFTFDGTEFTATGLQGTDTIGSVTLSSAGAPAMANVGNYSIMISGATGGTFNPSNYAITYDPGTLMVTPANLAITVNSLGKTYGQTLTFAGTEFTAAGLQNGETIGSVSLASAGAPATASVGAYPITIGAATGGTFDPGNYSISYVPGTLTVDPASLAVTASNAALTYNGLAYAEGNGVTYSGFANGDTAASLGGTLSYGGSSQGAVNAGSYSVVPSGLTSSNYTISFDPGTLTINPALLTITAASGGKTYGQGFAGSGFTASGLVAGQTVGSVTLSSAGSPATANVGSYAITPSNATGGTFSPGNYSITYDAGTLTVDPATLTYAANTASFALGSPEPSFSGTVTGFVNGDTLAGATTGNLVFSSPATVTSPMGSYAIDGSGLSAGNYVFVQASGNAAALTIHPYPFGSLNGPFAQFAAQTASGSNEGSFFGQSSGAWAQGNHFPVFATREPRNYSRHGTIASGGGGRGGSVPPGMLAFASSFTVPDPGTP